MPQAQTQEFPQNMPLVTVLQNRSEGLTKDAKLINCIVEKDLLTGDYWVDKRGGLAIESSPGGVGRGVYNWLNDVYSIFGNSLYKNGVFLATVDDTNGVYEFTAMRCVPPLLMLGNGVASYYTNGTTLSPITDDYPEDALNLLAGTKYTITFVGTSNFMLAGAAANTIGTVFTATGNTIGTGTAAFTAGTLSVNALYTIDTIGTTDFTLIGAASNTIGLVFVATGVGVGTGTVTLRTYPLLVVKGWAYLDGTLYVMTPAAEIYGSKNLDDPKQWDPLNKIIARIEPDGGVALAKHLVYVIALKQWTSEAFYDAGNPSGSPLGPVPGSKSAYGCVNADSVQDIDDNLIWLASNRKASPQVVMMTNLKVSVISTPSVERLIDQSNNSAIASWVFKHGGHRFYGLTIKSFNLTLVYDLDQQIWVQWTDADGNYWPIVEASFDATAQHLVQGETSGNMYYSENQYEYPTDAGVTFPVNIYTPNAEFGVDRRKTLNMMQFYGDQVNGSTLYIQYTDDDYQSWSSFRTVNMGNKRPILTGCGTFYRRAWHLRHYSATTFRIKWVSLQIDVGTL